MKTACVLWHSRHEESAVAQVTPCIHGIAQYLQEKKGYKVQLCNAKFSGPSVVTCSLASHFDLVVVVVTESSLQKYDFLSLQKGKRPAQIVCLVKKGVDASRTVIATRSECYTFALIVLTRGLMSFHSPREEFNIPHADLL